MTPGQGIAMAISVLCALVVIVKVLALLTGYTL